MRYLNVLTSVGPLKPVNVWTRALKTAAVIGAIGFAPAMPVWAQTEPQTAQAPVTAATGQVTLQLDPFVATTTGAVTITITTTHTAELSSSTTAIFPDSFKRFGTTPISITAKSPVTISSSEAAITTTVSTPSTTTTTIVVTSATAKTIISVSGPPGTALASLPGQGTTVLLPAPGMPGIPGAPLRTDDAASIYKSALTYAKFNVKSKDFVTAEINAKSALAIAPTPADKAAALTLLGGVYQSRGMYEQAAAQWSALAALKDPENEDDNAMVASLGLAQSLASQGKIEDAIARLDASRAKTEADPEFDEKDKPDAEAVFALGKAAVYLKAKQYGDARLQFEGLSEAASGDATYGALALIGIAESDVLQRNFPQALVSYRRVLNFKAANEKFKVNAQKQIALLSSTLAPETKGQELQANLLIYDKLFDSIARGVSVGFNDDETGAK